MKEADSGNQKAGLLLMLMLHTIFSGILLKNGVRQCDAWSSMVPEDNEGGRFGQSEGRAVVDANAAHYFQRDTTQKRCQTMLCVVEYGAGR